MTSNESAAWERLWSWFPREEPEAREALMRNLGRVMKDYIVEQLRGQTPEEEA